jgi:hypothetical protein
MDLKDDGRHQEQQRQKKKKKHVDKKKSAHPYKGKRIDVSG